MIVVAQYTHPSLHGSYMQETDTYSREMIAWLKTFLTDGQFEDLDMSSNYNPSPHHQTDGQWSVFSFCTDGSLLLPITTHVRHSPRPRLHPPILPFIPHLHIYTALTPHVATPATPPFIALTLASKTLGNFSLLPMW